MNLINYSPYTFDDSSIISGSLAMQNALCFDSLVPDELTVEVISNATGKRKLLTVYSEWYHTSDGRGYVVAVDDLRKFTYGDPVLYYYDDVLQGKFYIRSVERLSVDRFRLSAFSAVGLWASVTHLGGIYTGETAGMVIADLLSGYSYSIESDVAAVPLYGYLPIASIRDNLQQVLFALGASLMKDASGNPHIAFLTNNTPISVGGDRIYIGGKLTYKTPATSVTITEHSYYKSSYDVEVSLFDNSDGSGSVTNKLVTFEEPCYDLAAHDSLTINSSGVNYAYVSGIGTLTGTKYTHTTKTFSVETGVTGEPKESKVEKATLVSAANSANVAARVRDYESTAEEVACGIVMDTDGIKPGSLITFTDPYDDDTQGFVAKMNVTMSGKSKADCTVVKNYTPGHFGNNFESYEMLTTSGTYIAQKTGLIRVVLVQGGQGGQGGQCGTHGDSSAAGSGGSGGSGGNPGKIFVADLNVTQGQTFAYTIGHGGSGGLYQGEGEEGELGNEGTHSTFGSYTSADGAIPANGYINILTGEVYAEVGVSGIQGGNGGLRDYGQDVSYEGSTWEGGWPLGSGDNRAGGGGAAYGENGGYATSTASGMKGGAGAYAYPLPLVATLGSGGAGGNGGGGGGSGTRYASTNGEYGIGSEGNYGGDGFILVYS